MGPGGSRGLQILVSGASRVRGGFDSHAFPPLLALLIALGAATAGTARAADPDTVTVVSGAAPDSLALPEAAPADTAPGRRARARPRRPFDEPRWVMLRSLVVPGWGQLHNGSWLKAAAVLGLEVHLGRLVVRDLSALDRIEARVIAARASGDGAAESAAVAEYNARLDTLTRRQWWLGATVAYALLDAYIDAHFRNFEADFEYDPALEGGQPAARMRLQYRWRF